MFAKRAEHVLRIRPSLVVLGLVHPENVSVRTNEKGGRDRERLRTRRRRGPRMYAPIPETEAIRDLESTVGEHHSLQSVFFTPPRDLARCFRADRDDAYSTCVELRSQLFPSPQLGDTVGSPMATKKLDQRRIPSELSRGESLILRVDR
jgi:hypothetical protein